ncbi:MAG: transaldolase [Smithellaceae bacterium]|nr:transaldolase [Smithellaceae bacterium]
MKTNNLLKLEALGQSIWLDALSRRLIRSGELARLIAADGLTGVTSNPAIFEKAIAETSDYDDAINVLATQGKTTAEIYETLVIEDISETADLLLPVYEKTDGRDGYVSIEVSPRLARDTMATIDEAHRLWAAVGRPNIFIKVPATREGLPAITRLIAAGINVNITLLFGLPRYREVALAYTDGLEERVHRNLPLRKVASVASFFLSRIDVMVDPLLERIMTDGGKDKDRAAALHGEVAIACAKAAYGIFSDIFRSNCFAPLAGKGARVQRLLWASTGTKNPAYSDVKYIEPLIGADTINTVPPETLEAYRDHGKPASRLSAGAAQAKKVLTGLAELGIDLSSITQALEDEGLDKFIKPCDQLLKSIAIKRAAVSRST